MASPPPYVPVPDLTSTNVSSTVYYGPNFRATTSSGKYVMEQLILGSWTVVQISDISGTMLSTSVSTGVGSFHLGDVHSISSAGQNVVFTNQVYNTSFFPVWQGQSADGSVIIDPSARLFQDQNEVPSNGGLSTIVVAYYVDLAPPVNISVTKLTVMPAETSVTGGYWLVLEATTDKEVARVNIPSWTEGVELIINFDHPLDIRAGDVAHTMIVRKDNGNVMQCKAGLNNTTKPWRLACSRVFTDDPVHTSSSYATSARKHVRLTTAQRNALGASSYQRIIADTTDNNVYKLAPNANPANTLNHLDYTDSDFVRIQDADNSNIYGEIGFDSDGIWSNDDVTRANRSHGFLHTKFVNYNLTVDSASEYEVDTTYSVDGITLLVTSDWTKSFIVSDAGQSFSNSLPCIVDFTAFGQGLATLKASKNSFKFYFDDVHLVWKYKNLLTNFGGTV